MAVTKQEAINARDTKAAKYLENFLDPNLLAGHRSFDVSDLVRTSNNMIEAHQMVDFLGKIYKDWNIKRNVGGDQRDWYDNINFS